MDDTDVKFENSRKVERLISDNVRTDLFVDLLQSYPNLFDTSMLLDRVKKKREALEGFQREFNERHGIYMTTKQIYKKLQNVYLAIQSKLKRSVNKRNLKDYEVIFMQLKENMVSNKYRGKIAADLKKARKKNKQIDQSELDSYSATEDENEGLQGDTTDPSFDMFSIKNENYDEHMTAPLENIILNESESHFVSPDSQKLIATKIKYFEIQTSLAQKKIKVAEKKLELIHKQSQLADKQLALTLIELKKNKKYFKRSNSEQLPTS